ncbi:MAG: type II toxin-antitoxin system Phd/YefM family antitoxin [Candidatus Sulfotelmatobacter sp.]
MKQMPAGEFKAQCLAVMDQVSESGEPVLITKHGKPVASLQFLFQPAAGSEAGSSAFSRRQVA